MRKELPEQLLRELLKNSKRSDRKLAKILDVSQPTVTRTRKKLEKKGVIQDYTIIPDFKKMGFKLMAINFVKIDPASLTPEATERAIKFTARLPNTIFASAGEGMGMNGVSISFYKNYSEYSKSVSQSRSEWKDLFADVQSFVIALEEDAFKRLSLTYLKDVLP
jgi:DNA-binding Lrp family transcriptional regulator